MQDIPPEISVALAVVRALTASGRCREDGELYEPAKAGLRLYLEGAFAGRGPDPAPGTGVFPAAAVIPHAAASPPVVTAPADLPTGPPPRADAIWDARIRCWLVPRAA